MTHSRHRGYAFGWYAGIQLATVGSRTVALPMADCRGGRPTAWCRAPPEVPTIARQGRFWCAQRTKIGIGLLIEPHRPPAQHSRCRRPECHFADVAARSALKGPFLASRARKGPVSQRSYCGRALGRQAPHGQPPPIPGGRPRVQSIGGVRQNCWECLASPDLSTIEHACGQVGIRINRTKPGASSPKSRAARRA
jgi:hypothetical protein